ATTQGTASRFFEKMLEGWLVVATSTHPGTERTFDNGHVRVPPSLPLPVAPTEPRPGLPSEVTLPSSIQTVQTVPIGPDPLPVTVEGGPRQDDRVKPVDPPHEEQVAVTFPASGEVSDNSNGSGARLEQRSNSSHAVPTEMSPVPSEVIQEAGSETPVLE